ncbi:MAG: MBL fold metallo-hydrolase [Gemmatimonadota bacterium]
MCQGALALLQAERYPDCVPAHEVIEVFPGDGFAAGEVAVAVGRAFHPLDARCYRLTDGVTGASVVVTGDTAYHEGLVEFARDCDVLVHEAAAAPSAAVADLQRYLHSRPQDAARVAQEAGASALALVHYAAADGAAILARAKEVFPNARLVKRGQRLQLMGRGQAAWI